MIGRTGSSARIHCVHAVLDVAQLLGGEACGVAEVEAQLVGTDVGAGLAHMLAEALAQRGV